MSELSDTLRLQIAQFNNFLIENYLVKTNVRDDKSKPQAYLFNSFFNLSEHFANIGSTIGSLNNLKPGSLVPLKEAIAEAVNIVYLIEESANIGELTSKIVSINTANLLNTIKKITAYGKEFQKPQAEIDAEIDDLKQDNADYFNYDGTLGFESYEIAQEEKIDYLSNHSTVLQVKDVFRKIKKTFQYFSSIISGTANSENDYTTDNVFIGHLLVTLTTLLMALGYIEPFFQKPDNIARSFELHVKNISATQSAVLNDLS